jgi:hypothetical protein
VDPAPARAAKLRERIRGLPIGKAVEDDYMDAYSVRHRVSGGVNLHVRPWLKLLLIRSKHGGEAAAGGKATTSRRGDAQFAAKQ